MGLRNTSDILGLVEKRQTIPDGKGAEDQTVSVFGSVRLGDLARAMRIEYRVSIIVPPDLADVEVSGNGELKLAELLALIESHAKCQVVEVGGHYQMVREGQEFWLVVPQVFESLPGIQFSRHGGYVVASGPYERLPALRRVLAVVDLVRPTVRARLWIVDDTWGTDVAATVSDPFRVAWDGGLVGSWAFDAFFSAGVSEGFVLRELDACVIDGVLFALSDSSELRLQQFVTGESGEVFSSEFEVVEAGLKVQLTPVKLGGYWRVTGDVEISDFSESGDVPVRNFRTLPVGVDLVEGSAVRIARLYTERLIWNGGIAGNLPRVSRDRGQSRLSVWLALEPIERSPLRRLPISPPAAHNQPPLHN